MTSLEKARAYFQANGKKLALAVAPLAIAAVSAVPAHATVIVFDPTTAGAALTGNYNSGGGTLTGAQLSLYNGIEGVTYTGSGSVTNDSSGGTTGIMFTASGGGTGTFAGGSLPVDYDFTLTPSDGGVVNWEVIYTIDGSGAPSSVTFSGATGGGPATVSGSGFLTETDILNSYEVQFEASWNASDGATLNVSIPSGSGGSLDLASTPEPATLFFAGPGMAFLMLRARRKSRK